MSDGILLEVRDGWGLITLDAPRRLNALSEAMCAAMGAALARWRLDDDVRAVMIRGAGDRAFCAGGDIRDLYAARKAGDIDGAMRFFATEYRNNWRVWHFPKPFVALIDGIVMGGGVGVSLHGRYRVATEKALFAMPECGIGLYPDVGTTHLLPGLAGRAGMYLGLTGARMSGAEMLGLGLATHHTTRARLPGLEAALMRVDWRDGAAEAIERVLDRFHEVPADPAPVIDRRFEIDADFGHGSVEAIINALKARGGDRAENCLKTLAVLCPASLKLTHDALGRAGQDFDTCLIQEYRRTHACVTGPNFIEGIRAQIIDKDRAPRWQPPTLAEVGDIPDFTVPLPGEPVFGWED